MNKLFRSIATAFALAAGLTGFSGAVPRAHADATQFPEWTRDRSGPTRIFKVCARTADHYKVEGDFILIFPRSPRGSELSPAALDAHDLQAGLDSLWTQLIEPLNLSSFPKNGISGDLSMILTEPAANFEATMGQKYHRTIRVAEFGYKDPVQGNCPRSGPVTASIHPK